MNDLEVLESSYRKQKSAFDREVGEARGIKLRLVETQAEITHLEDQHESLEEAIAVLNSFADTQQQELQTKIETLVSEGLKTVFGEDLSFHAVTKTQGKAQATEFVIRSKFNGEVIETPIMEARGGGVAAVAGFLLRLILVLLRDDARHILFLDESFAQLSAEYEPRLAEFIKELVERTSVQIVLVTHSNAYDDVADKIYRFKAIDGATVIEG